MHQLDFKDQSSAFASSRLVCSVLPQKLIFISGFETNFTFLKDFPFILTTPHQTANLEAT